MKASMSRRRVTELPLRRGFDFLARHAAHAEHTVADRLVIVLDANGARAPSHPKTQMISAYQWPLAPE
jgi:hypothetical protein